MSKSKTYLPVDFRSNPPLREKPVVVPEDKNGVIRNKVVFVPDSNRSPFEGVVYSPETMSLRAKLNLGVQFSRVNIGQIENDPTALYNRALHMEKDIFTRLDELSSPVALDVPAETHVES